MPDPAPAQLARLVHLIAWMSQRDTGASVSYAAAARHLGVSRATIRDDLDALARLGERYRPWLASLSVAYTARGFVLGSRGPFRRPFRLTPDEALALVAGLAGCGAVPRSPPSSGRRSQGGRRRRGRRCGRGRASPSAPRRARTWKRCSGWRARRARSGGRSRSCTAARRATCAGG